MLGGHEACILQRGPDLRGHGGDELGFLARERAAAAPLRQSQRADDAARLARRGVGDRHGKDLARDPGRLHPGLDPAGAERAADDDVLLVHRDCRRDGLVRHAEGGDGAQHPRLGVEDAQRRAARAHDGGHLAQNQRGHVVHRPRTPQQFADGVEEVNLLVSRRELPSELDGIPLGVKNDLDDREQSRREVVVAVSFQWHHFEEHPRRLGQRQPGRRILPGGAGRTRGRGAGGGTRQQAPSLTVELPESQGGTGQRAERREGPAEVVQQRGSVIQMVFPRSLKAT